MVNFGPCDGLNERGISNEGPDTKHYAKSFTQIRCGTRKRENFAWPYPPTELVRAAAARGRWRSASAPPTSRRRPTPSRVDVNVLIDIVVVFEDIGCAVVTAKKCFSVTHIELYFLTWDNYSRPPAIKRRCKPYDALGYSSTFPYNVWTYFTELQ